MPSSYSTRLRLEKQNIGENNNTWGSILNSNVIDLVDEAVAGLVTINFGTTAGDCTLSSSNGATDEARRQILVLTGAPVSNVALNVPAQTKTYTVHSKHTGTKWIKVRPVGAALGAEVTLAAGEKKQIYINTAKAHNLTPDLPAAAAAVPAGVVVAWSGSYTAIPTGWGLCDGSAGRPDLRDRFIMGAASAADCTGSSWASGGSQLKTTTSNGSHSHTSFTGYTALTSADIPAHSHKLGRLYNGTSSNFYTINGSEAVFVINGDGVAHRSIVTTANPDYSRTNAKFSGPGSGHRHSIGTESDHGHTITDARPPYLKLAWIIKL